ncbi:MAG: outer membrane protein transport protein [Bacteroidota bacterium]
MKKNLIYLLIILAALIYSSYAEAQIDNLTNLSPEWIRSGARNAATDGTDIMAYNPGGVARLKPGFHIAIGNQFFFRHPSHEYSFDYGGGAQTYTHKQDGNDLVTPNIYLSYNKNKWAIFAGVNVVGGGGEANYPGGSVNTDLIAAGTIFGFDTNYGTDYTAADAYLKASSFSIAVGAGGSYLVNDKISFGIYVRNVMSKNKTEAGITLTGSPSGLPDQPFLLKTENNASGIGVIAGIDIKPVEKLNIAARYESKVKLNLKTKQIHDDFGFTLDGEKNRRDLPAVAGLGIAYSVNDKFKILFDFNYYFQKQADWDTTYLSGDLVPNNAVKTSELAGDAAEYGLGLEYKISPKFLASLGGTYTAFNFNNQDAYYTNVGAFEVGSNDNFTVNAGFAYNVTEKIKINLGFMEAVYSTQNIKALNFASIYPYDVIVTSKNKITSIALGVDFLF